MRVGIICINHESNTFIPKPTTLDDFRQIYMISGEPMRKRFTPAYHELGGFFEGLEKEKIEAVPIFAALAGPNGAVAADALDALLKTAFDGLDQAGKLDGLLVAPHGAGVSESHPDMDGYWLTELRKKVGPAMPIMCTLDPHANLTPRMLDAVNATTVYRTNPHIDQRQCGLEAASLLARTLRGEIKPTQAGSFPRIAINIERQNTASAPCRPMYDLADAMLKRPGVLSNAIILGFPYADVEELGSAFIVVTDNDKALAQKLADEMAAYLWEHRHDFAGQFLTTEQALDEAAKASGTVCLLDMGDNVGGGAPGDSTEIARAIQRRGGPRAFVALHDPPAVQKAVAAGVGQRLRLSMGGKSQPLYYPPLEAEVTVRSIHDGKFIEPQVRHGGLTHFDMGVTVIVETDQGLTIQLHTHRVWPVSLRQLTSCGIETVDYRILIAKGVQAPVAAYAPVCTKLIRVNTPGVTDADMRRLGFKHRRKPLFPFEDGF